MKIKLLDNKPYTYELLETSYKNCDYKNKKSWIAFKEFFEKFTKKVFETNLAIFTGKGYIKGLFPLAYSEKKSYASISHSLHSITPYVLSEWHLNYKSNKKPKNRFVDFWCMLENQKIEAWIEVKNIWFNLQTDNFAETIKKIYNDDKDKEYKKMGIIQQGLIQLDSVRTEIRNDKIANSAFKVVLLNIPIFCSCPISKKIDNDKINNAPKKLEEMLNNFIESKDFPAKNYKKGVLCAVLDLDPQGTRKDEVIFENYYMPYFALAAVVLE